MLPEVRRFFLDRKKRRDTEGYVFNETSITIRNNLVHASGNYLSENREHGDKVARDSIVEEGETPHAEAEQAITVSLLFQHLND